MFMPGFMPWWGPGVGRQPDLEVLHRRPPNGANATPLVFVHGAFVGAWCWDEYFLRWFADRGYDVYALSLRGHGDSGGDLDASGISDYVADLASVVEQLATPPVIIAHSMGALVAQRYIERHAAAAAVFMASVPLTGLMESSLRLFRDDPNLFSQMALMEVSPKAVDLSVAQRAIFSDHIDAALLDRCARRVQRESERAVWDMTMGALARPWRAQAIPMLVMGAEEDRLFSPSEIRRLGEAYSAPVHIESGMAHAMMLEPGWEGIAQRIEGWLRDNPIA